MEDRERFKRSLIRMLQTGIFQEIIGCRPGACARVEFRMLNSFEVQLTRRHAVVEERDVETVRRLTKGRWARLSPMVRRKDRIVIERSSGRILALPPLGIAAREPAVTRRNAPSVASLLARAP